MGHPVSVRSASETDLIQVLAMWREARDWEGATDDLASMKALVRSDGEALLLAGADHRILGPLIAAWDGWRGNMYRLTVHPSHRRRGIAHQRVAAGEDRLRALGARRIAALVWGADDRATDLWRAVGYEATTRDRALREDPQRVRRLRGALAAGAGAELPVRSHQTATSTAHQTVT